MAERLQHGLVNVLMDPLNTGAIEGLQQQFAENVYVVNSTGHHVPLTMEQQRENCRIICHSNIFCSFWQSYYDQGNTADLGCWTENPGVDATGSGQNIGGFVAYPTTTSVYSTSLTRQPADKITGGQYIQHYCDLPTLPTRPSTTTTTTTTVVVQAPVVPTAPPPESGGFMNPWGYMLIVFGLLAGLGAVALMMLNPKKPPPKKTSRAVKPIKAKTETPPPPAPAPPPPPQPVVPLMAQPVMVQPTIPQPLTMTTIQQPTTVAAQAVAQPVAQAVAQPVQMATYAAAPQLVQGIQRPY